MRRTNTAINYVINMRSPGTVYAADYNDYLIANTGYTKMGYANGTAYVALADWQTGVTQDAHSLGLNPGYEAPATGNFKPTASNTAPAALNDKGTPVGIATDLVNFSRSATVPDIGAYEFGCSTFPGASVVADSIAVCSGSPVSFTIKTPEAGVSYTWYTTATGGSPIFTGNPYTVNNVTTPIEFWVKGATAIGCTNGLFTHVKAVVYSKLAQPVATLDTAGVDILRFKWNAVAGATGYLVSRDGVNFITPSSGATGLTHTITGLNPLDTAGLVVKAVGVLACQEAVSARVSGRTRSNEFFIPNTFTPNGDGRNDVFRVYGNTIKSIRVMVFNQWGEKVFETSSPAGGWDGIYKGAPAPIGVYVYVVNLTLADGTVTVKKGSLNLVR
jgi:gliding motility-associated-like protein